MKNKLLGISLITISCLYGMLAAVIILVFYLTDLPVLYGIILSIIILIVQFLVAPFFTDLSMKWFYGARFDYDVPEYLKDFINEICTKYNMKMPKVGYIDDGAPNAFTYGRTKNDARIVLTRGIFELLTEDEAKAVVGHELGHVVHYDMLFMTVAQLVPLVLYAVYESSMNSSKSDKDNSNAAVIGAVAYILYIISQYIILWLSRTREYYADSFSVEETKNPNSLAEALVKIGYGLSTNAGNRAVNKKGKQKQSASKSNALGIFDSKTSKSLIVSSFNNGHVSKDKIKNAMKWEMWNVWGLYYELNSTHPLISKRLLAISERSKDYNQEPYIVFDLEKPESYVDDFFAELFIKFMPLIPLLALIIILIINDKNPLLKIGISGILITILSYIKLARRYKNSNYPVTTVSNLLGEVKVSDITSIPCTINGKIIGRGNPGCIFNEDFIIQDETGIIFIDYNQPINIVNKIFAIFKSKEYFDKTIKVTGWYRRSPVPYIEIYKMEVDGKVKTCFTYPLAKGLRIALGVFSVVAIVASFM